MGDTRARLRPGIPEIVVGLAVFAVSGVAGILGFLAALSVRVRSLRPFGVRATTGDGSFSASPAVSSRSW